MFHYVFFIIGPEIYVYKCLAHKYVTDEGEEVTTQFVVIPTTSISGTLAVGNIIVGNGSNGFLETVTEIVQEKDTKFVYTELSSCFSGFSNSKT